MWSNGNQPYKIRVFIEVRLGLLSDTFVLLHWNISSFGLNSSVSWCLTQCLDSSLIKLASCFFGSLRFDPPKPELSLGRLVCTEPSSLGLDCSGLVFKVSAELVPGLKDLDLMDALTGETAGLLFSLDWYIVDFTFLTRMSTKSSSFLICNNQTHTMR